MLSSESYWKLLEQLVSESEIIIDRPKGTCHPKFKETIYEVDYGYLQNTKSMDGEGIDVFVGTLGKHQITGVALTVDLYQKDTEIIILIDCNENEKHKIQNYITKYESMQGIIIDRTNSYDGRYEIRKARFEDVAILSKIQALSWKKAFKGIMPQDFLNNLKEDYWIEFFENGIKNKSIEVLIAYSDNHPVGEVTYGKARDENLPDWGEIISIYMLPEYFHKGFGTKLLTSAIQNLKEQGFENIYIWVLKENYSAQKFYEKHGFIETDEEYHFEKGGKKLVDIKYILKI